MAVLVAIAGLIQAHISKPVAVLVVYGVVIIQQLRHLLVVLFQIPQGIQVVAAPVVYHKEHLLVTSVVVAAAVLAVMLALVDLGQHQAMEVLLTPLLELVVLAVVVVLAPMEIAGMAVVVLDYLAKEAMELLVVIMLEVVEDLAALMALI